MSNKSRKKPGKGGNKGTNRSSVKRPKEQPVGSIGKENIAIKHSSTKKHDGGKKLHRYVVNYKGTNFEYAIGFLAASIFSLAYYVVPFWLSSAVVLTVMYPFSYLTWAVVTPVIISALVPPIAARRLLQTKPFQCIPMYFGYREVMEASHAELAKLVEERPTIISLHPHGVFSMVALSSACVWSKLWWDPATTPTAAADSIVHVPILKHIVGLLGITSASAKPLIKNLNDEKNRGVILYVGGTSELFLTNSDRERLHLLDRKGFIKIALTQGCSIVPGYLFGNTHVLKLLQWSFLRYISRKTGFAMTYLYGRFFLPMPLPAPCTCAIGTPIHFPKIENPTREEVDKWHAFYVSEIRRIFDTYKVEAPGYENKVLEIE